MKANPQTPQPQHLTETLSVRLPLPAFRALVERAKSESRTLSNLVRVLLERESQQRAA